MSRSSAAVLSRVHRLLLEQQIRSLEDLELLELFLRERVEDAFAELVRRHGALVWWVCRRVLRNSHDADDVFQATFLVLARKASSIRKRGSLPSWLHGVAYRLSLKCLAGTRRRREKEQALSDHEHASCDEFSRRELCSELIEELERLPERQRAPLLLCYAEGKSQQEAARELGWSRGTLKRRLERGREILRQRLTRRGFALTAGLVGCTQAELLAFVPEARLVATTIRIAGLLIAGEQAAALPMTATVAALVNGMLQPLSMSKLKLAAVLLFAMSLIGSAGVIAHQALNGGTDQALLASTNQPAPEKQNEAQAPAESRRGVDLAGDLLPAGAVKRLGSTRFRGDNLAFSADGKVMATSQAHIVFLLDTATGREIRRFPGHAYRVDSFALAADAKLLATGEQNAVILWDVDSGKEIRSFTGDFGSPSKVQFSPDGEYLAVSADKCLSPQTNTSTQLYELSSGRRVWRVGGPDEDRSHVLLLGFSRDGQALLTHGGKGALVVRDPKTGKALRTLTPEIPWPAVAFAARAPVFAATNANDGAIDIWDLPEGKKLQRVSPPTRGIRQIALSEDGARLASYAGKDKFIQIWNVGTGKETAQVAVDPGPVAHLAFVPGRNALAYVLWPEHFIQLVDIGTGQPLYQSNGHRGQVQAIAYSPDGKRLASGSTDDTIRYWDASSGKEIAQSAARQLYVCSVTYSPDGKRLASAGYNSLELCLWDALTGAELRRWKAHDSAVRRVCFSPDGKLLASRCRPMQPNQAEYSIKLWDVVSGQEVRRFDKLSQQDTENNLAFSADGSILFASDNPATRAWHIETGKELAGVAELFRTVRFLALSPDGKSMLGAAERPGGGPGSPVVPKEAQVPAFALWELSTGKERLRFEGIPVHGFSCFVFSPDGRILAAGGGSSTMVYLWDTHTGKRLGTLEGHDNWIMDLAFAPDSKTLASASYDTTVLMWDMTGRLPERGELRSASAEELAKHWLDLAGDDAFQAYQAILKLAAAPHLSVPLLRAHLHPASATGMEAMAKQIQDLDSPRFADRERASRALDALGDSAVPQLERALGSPLSAEARRRVDSLLERARRAALKPDVLRAVRAVEVLDLMNTKEARALLASLAAGAPGARLTQEAKASLARFARGPKREN